jgi:hypothetical protein
MLPELVTTMPSTADGDDQFPWLMPAVGPRHPAATLFRVMALPAPMACVQIASGWLAYGVACITTGRPGPGALHSTASTSP